jgi:hypothetical protein
MRKCGSVAKRVDSAPALCFLLPVARCPIVRFASYTLYLPAASEMHELLKRVKATGNG